MNDALLEKAIVEATCAAAVLGDGEQFLLIFLGEGPLNHSAMRGRLRVSADISRSSAYGFEKPPERAAVCRKADDGPS
jgi:hypothetical protein